MTGATEVLEMKQEDALKFLATATHLSVFLDLQMEQFTYKRTTESIHIITLKRPREKLLP